MTAPFDRITIIGLGLIGSSIARAAHEYKLAEIIVGCDDNEHALTYGRSHGFIHVAMRDPALAVAESQLVILATPPDALANVAKTMAPGLAEGVIVMDTASVKQPAMDAIAPHVPANAWFIPAHPIAGGEQSGVAAGRADLFKGKQVIITPQELPEGSALKYITAFWTGMGARVEGMPPQVHDLIYAYVSHLPQLLAFAAYSVLEGPTAKDPDLARFLRISRSNPALWTEIFFANKENVIKALENYLKVVSHIASELSQAPADAPSKEDIMLAGSVLFPRIAASCLVTTVMEAERAAGVPFARYAGGGFADFTSPVETAPEEDLEKISTHHQLVAALLKQYIARLAEFRTLLASGKTSQLQKLLTH